MVAAAVTAAVLSMPPAYSVLVPVIAWVVVIPATVRVPLDAVMDPAVMVRDAEDAMPADCIVAIAVIAAELCRPPAWSVVAAVIA